MKTLSSAALALALLCSAVAAYAEYQMNEMPLYGGQHDPQVPEDKKASVNAAELGWKYFYNEDHATAIKRFNQAWMLDRNNFQAYWGFGLIMGARSTQENTKNNLEESIKFLEQALDLSKNNARLMVDLAYSETMLGAFLKNDNGDGFQHHFDNARNLYKRSETIDSTYPLLYSNWSLLDFFEEKYNEAKNKLMLAKTLGFSPNLEY